jgi:hypothetical protein
MSLVEGSGWPSRRKSPSAWVSHGPRPEPEKTGVLLTFKAADSDSMDSLRRHSKGL